MAQLHVISKADCLNYELKNNFFWKIIGLID